MELTHKVEIYIPSYTKDGEPLGENIRDWATGIVSEGFCKAFGGCTQTEGRGSYINQAGKLAVEPVTIVCAYATEKAFAESGEHVDSLASYIGAILTQESVLFTKDNKATLLFLDGEGDVQEAA